MDVERQKGMGDQLDLWEELSPMRPGVSGEVGNRTSAHEEQQASAASVQKRALTSNTSLEGMRR